MPVNPHVKGGSDVPVTDGGTGASSGGAALTNLGGLSSSAHATVNHAGIPGVGDLTNVSHAALDHSGISGVGGVALGLGSGLGTSTSGSISVPAGTITQAGDYLRFVVGYTNASQTNTISFSFGGQLLSGFFQIGNVSTAFEQWRIEITYLGGTSWHWLSNGFGDQSAGDMEGAVISGPNPAGALTFNYSKSGGSEKWSLASGFAAIGG